MNFIFFFLTFSTFLAAIHGMHPDFRHRIQTFYKGDFRTVMALYNKYINGDDIELVNPCERYSEMEVLLNPQEFTSIEWDVMINLNTTLALTFDGHSNFSIQAVMKCAVMNDRREVFRFFVLLLPEWATSFTENNLNFIPVYNYGPADGNWQLFAVKDVYDFHVLRSTFPDKHRNQLGIWRTLRNPRYHSVIDTAVNNAVAYHKPDAKVVDWKNYFDNFVLHLDEKSKVEIPAITVIKVEIRCPSVIEYLYLVIFGYNSRVDYPAHPFRYTKDFKKGFRYKVYYTGKIVDGMLAFSLDRNLVHPKTNVYQQPPFVAEIDVIHGMHPYFRYRIRTFYEGDFRTIMALYNKYHRPTESDDNEMESPCLKHLEMEILLYPQEFTSIESRVHTSLNTVMALTLDGHSNFSIYAITECAVMKDDRKVFEFFILLLPEWAKSFSKRDFNFIPVYSYGPAVENRKWFAVKDVYDFKVIRDTFTGNAEDELRIRAELQNPEIIPTAIQSLTNVPDFVDILNTTHHFDNFILILDERSRVRIPAITIFKLRIRKETIGYKYMILFSKNPNVQYPPNPFRYPNNGTAKGIFRYVIFNTGEMVDGMWAFSLDINFVYPKNGILLNPPFIDELDF